MRFSGCGLLPLFVALASVACSSRLLPLPHGTSPDLESAVALQLDVSDDNLQIPEGETRTINVSLVGDLPGAVTVSIVSSDPAAVPVTPSTLTFDSTHRVAAIMINAPIDDNEISEVATIALASDWLATVRVAVTIQDRTEIVSVGASTPFDETWLMTDRNVSCLKAHLDDALHILALGAITPLATSHYRMALYANDATPSADNPSERPGLLLAAMPNAVQLVDGVNLGAVDGDVVVAAGEVWICAEFDENTDLGVALAQPQTAVMCYRNQDLVFNQPWPSTLGLTSCSLDFLPNLFFTGDRQQ